MRTVTQRVSRASVTIEGELRCQIGQGLLILVGFEATDTQEDIDWMARKLLALRIFDDERGVMNRSVTDVGGEVCIVSQFTLHALTAKGNRPAYIRAASRDIAVPLYEKFIQAIERGLSRPVATGVFGANMQVELVNDGPVTILLDTKNKE